MKGWKDRDGKKEEGGWVGGLLVISPEEDNGRGAHCNGCHVEPPCTISQSAACSASQEDA